MWGYTPVRTTGVLVALRPTSVISYTRAYLATLRDIINQHAELFLPHLQA